MTSDSGNLQENSFKPETTFCEDDAAAKFICHQCQKTFYNTTALLNHRKMHHGLYECSPGGASDTILISDDHNNDAELCDFKFIPSIPSNMEKLHTLNGVTTCKFLEDTTFLVVTLGKDCEENLDPQAHRSSDTDCNSDKKESVPFRGPFKCTYRSTMRPESQCYRIFFDCCSYSLHYREEHTKRRKAALRCQVCEKTLDRDTFLKNTVVEPIPSALSRQVFSCQICSQTFLESSEFEEHNRVFHTKTKPFGCDICPKRFSQQGGLQQHKRMHTGVRPFACTFCPKAFTQKAGLEQHMRTHTKVKPFRCVICGKCFSQSVHLRQHMRTHTNIQPFECTFCGKKFKQSSHLTFHMRSHVGEGGSLVVERYAQEMQQEQLQFLDIPNVQPVMDGDTMYYAAELPGPDSSHSATDSASASSTTPFFPFAYQS